MQLFGFANLFLDCKKVGLKTEHCGYHKAAVERLANSEALTILIFATSKHLEIINIEFKNLAGTLQLPDPRSLARCTTA